MPNFPSSLDTYTPVSGTTLLSTGHAGLHNNDGSAIVSIESKLGVGASSATSGAVLLGSGAGTSAWSTVWNNGNFGSPSITGGTVALALVNGTPSFSSGTETNTLHIGGTFNNPVLGTPTSPGTTLPIVFGVGITPNAGSFIDTAGGTVTVNAATAQIYYTVMGTAAGNRTINTPSNLTAWQYLEYDFKASGSANGTLVWGTIFQISQDAGTPSLGTGTSWNKFSWRYNPVSTKLDFVGQITNLI